MYHTGGDTLSVARRVLATAEAKALAKGAFVTREARMKPLTLEWYVVHGALSRALPLCHVIRFTDIIVQYPQNICASEIKRARILARVPSSLGNHPS